VTCDVAFVAMNIIGFGLLGIILIIAFLVVKRRLVALCFCYIMMCHQWNGMMYEDTAGA